MTEGRRLYLDANVLIPAVEQQGDLANRIRSLFGEPHDPLSHALVTSELTLAECLVRPMREGDEALVDRYEALLSGKGLLATLEVDWVILHMAATLRAMDKFLRLPDAIHVSSAIAAGCSAMLTGDKRLKKSYAYTYETSYGPRAWKVGPNSVKLVHLTSDDQAEFNELLEPEFRR